MAKLHSYAGKLGIESSKWHLLTGNKDSIYSIADKFLVSTVLILLIPLGRIEALLVVVLLNRDIIINGLRSFAASEGKIISAGSLGKWKTGLQMVAIPAILIYEPVGPLSGQWIGYWGLWASLVLSLISAGQYLWGYLKSLQLGH